MKILVTGSAGFIGSALSLRLLNRGDEVIGIDNHNDYYDPTIKELRLKRYLEHKNYIHLQHHSHVIYVIFVFQCINYYY